MRQSCELPAPAVGVLITDLQSQPSELTPHFPQVPLPCSHAAVPRLLHPVQGLPLHTGSEEWSGGFSSSCSPRSPMISPPLYSLLKDLARKLPTPSPKAAKIQNARQSLHGGQEEWGGSIPHFLSHRQGTMEDKCHLAHHHSCSTSEATSEHKMFKLLATIQRSHTSGEWEGMLTTVTCQHQDQFTSCGQMCT